MPRKNYTLTRVTSGEQDLEWDTNANKYVLSSSLVKPFNLYAWTVESGSSIYNGGDITTIYTKTPNPVLDTATGNFTEFYDKNGNLIGGPGYSSIMSWTLTNASGKTASETYVNSMSSSVIELKAIGPA